MPWPVLHVKLVVAASRPHQAAPYVLHPTPPYAQAAFIYTPCVIREVPGILSFPFPVVWTTPWRLSGKLERNKNRCRKLPLNVTLALVYRTRPQAP